jgi:CRP-like cAMP-binding protein
LDDEELAMLADETTEFTVPPGHVLIERGFPGLGMFLLESGQVEVELPDGGRIELGPGEFFGELALLTDRDRTARVQALTEVTCVALARDDFARLLDTHPRISVAMLGVLADRLAGQILG